MYFVETKLRFRAFQHPYVCTFVEELQESGVPGLLTLKNESQDADAAVAVLSWMAGGDLTGIFDHFYVPNDAVVHEAHPRYNVDFDRSGAYSDYNWELFFHIPLLIATRLMQDERHQEAMRWFHFIFNPTTDSKDPSPERYWFCKPLRDAGKPESIKQILQALQDPAAPKGDIETAINEWRDHPFEPHRVARQRPGAYQKTVVLKYLDNLLAWADKLFLRDTIESINEATQLYVLAARLLGPRPQKVPELVTASSATYEDLRETLDAFGNGLVALENIAVPFTPKGGAKAGSGGESLLTLGTLYFCIPHNEDLLRYWDKVGDRLFKIRHCMNIEGVVRQLPLFEPPIDPALLVRARAMGLDLAAVLDDLSAPAPRYRFPFMLQKAREFCEEVKQLGGLLLATLEKKDAEQLAQIRSGHEKALLGAVRDVKKQQVTETEHTLAGLEQAKDQALLRQQFYSSRAFTIAGEQQQLEMIALAAGLQTAGQVLQLIASFAHAWPDQFIGGLAGVGGGALYFSRVAGGSPAGSGLQSAGRAMEILGNVAQVVGSASGILAGYRRRADDWNLQAGIAAADVKQLDKQIAAAEIRRQMAERDLANHELQIEQAAQTDEFLRQKFTNQDLYGWMSAQVSAVYFQAYRLAYDMAKRAERAYRIDLGIGESSFVQFGAWDSLRKGLLAGERLSLDLRRLEAAYLDQDKQTYELTKHVSLARLDPEEIVRLRETGECVVHIPEVLFDLDYPGHYMRRIKSVSMTIPSVTGPYTSLSCTLTLLKHSTRRTTGAGNDPDPDLAPLQSIATSSGRNDAGLFELNFREERRLPFEGAGAVSSWRIELPKKVRQFDYRTISDVIFHISYTALEGGGVFKHGREQAMTANLNKLAEVSSTSGVAKGLAAAFSLRRDFPNEWHRLRQGEKALLNIDLDRLPYFASLMTPSIVEAVWLVKSPPPTLKEGQAEVPWQKHPDIPDLSIGKSSIPAGKSLPLTGLELSATGAEKADDVLLLVIYTVTMPS